VAFGPNHPARGWQAEEPPDTPRISRERAVCETETAPPEALDLCS
jgi:hypothetical protein